MATMTKTERNTTVALGPFTSGMNNASGTGENIDDKEVYDLRNLEVDFDGSLANRPAIKKRSHSWDGTNIRVLGTYVPPDGRQMVVISAAGLVRIIDPVSGTSLGVSPNGVASVAVVQYFNQLWVIPTPGSTASGGYFSVATSGDPPLWTTVAAIPKGESAVVYKERLWIAAGLSSVNNTSRMVFSGIATFNTWGASDFLDISAGDGQKLVSLVVLDDDIIVFKEHSTYRYGYNTSPTKGDVTNISVNIGVPTTNCVVSYNNSNIYVLHDKSVYEMYNYTFTRISNPIALRQDIDLTLFASDLYGLTLFRDRLFVRYYSDLYVYSLITKTWSIWETTRKFSRLVVMPTSGVGLDTAYASSASSSDAGQLYFFNDDRISGVGINSNNGEQFKCSIRTKTYDSFTGQSRVSSGSILATSFKVLMWWGISIATSGSTTASMTLPNTGNNPTWNFMSQYTWDFTAANFTWDQQGDVVFSKVTAASTGGYFRKLLKELKKLRFRQAYFEVSTDALSNNVSDASVRFYDIILFMFDKQTVVKEVSV